MTNYIDENGFHKKRYQELRELIAENYKSNLGNDIKTDRSSVIGQLISIDAQSEDEIAGLIKELLGAFDVYQASGILLSRLAKLFGTNRKPGSFTTAQLNVTVSRDTNIRKGFKVKNANGDEFVTESDYHIANGTTGNIQVVSTKLGSFQSPANTITNIVTPVYGVEAVTNPLEASLGSKRETDTELRERLINGGGTESQTISGVNRVVSGITGVNKYKVIENRTANTLITGQQPHSLFFVISGATDTAIAEGLINRAVPAGIDYAEPSGVPMTEAFWTDPVTNQKYSCKFARPQDVNISIYIDISKLSSFSNNDSVEIKSSVKKYIDGLQFGSTIFNSDLYCPINAASKNIRNINKVLISLSSSNAYSESFSLLPHQQAVLDMSNISINGQIVQ